MTRLLLRFGLFAARHWRGGNERGITLFGVTVFVSTIAVVASFLFFSNQKNQGKNPLSGGAQDQATLTSCVQSAQSHLAVLQEQFPGGNIPADNADLQAIALCVQQVNGILQKTAGATPNPQWQQALTDLGALIASKDSCTFDISPTEAPAGAKSPPITLTVLAPATVLAPEQGGGDVVAIVTAASGESAQLGRTIGQRFEGKLTLDGTNATPFGGTSLTVSLSLNGAVLATQCPEKFFSWLEPVPPSGSLVAPATAKAGESFALTANVKNADSVSVTGDNGATYQQACNPQHFCNFLQTGVTITKDTVFTLTATQGGKTVTLGTRAVVLKTVAQGHYSLTLTAGRGVDETAVTDPTITVGGQVSPAPPAGITLSVTLGVNGSPVLTVPVTSSGSYVATVPLQKVFSQGDLTLSAPGITAHTCGAQSVPVQLTVAKKAASDVANVINAAVTTADGADSNIASLTVSAAVRVDHVRIDWSGDCPMDSGLEPGGFILRPGDTRTVGSEDCGVPCPGTGTSCTATTARAYVFTSAGSVFVDSPWVITIP